ncbi:MAG TPA: protein kinase [Terriglobales bacterium]|nr:protein kinase [Terriglobales bacterium]
MSVLQAKGECGPGVTLGHYQVLEKIGAGGMGEVYRARDEHLDRDVAIKILSPGVLADELSRKRFHKEAMALSKLNHPNIATIYDFDTQQGVDFLVMEYIAGSALSDKLAKGPLPEADTLRLGFQLAEGLVAAHEHGVIHRDLKPGNLRLTHDGRLKVLDFGLAKLRHPVTATAATETCSEGQGIIGTLPYMAPEQLSGEEVDERTDIHAVGLVLYEMATGQRPFAGVAPSQIIAAILRHSPAPPTMQNPGISVELERIIGKCLEKEPGNRYQTARELGIDLRRLAMPSNTGFAASSQAPGPHRRKRRLMAAIAIAGVLVAVLVWNWRSLQHRWWPASGPPQIRSLAVLPLANLSGDASQDYFADGMTESLITNVSKIRALKVISRTSVMQYKGVNKPLPQIARELGVEGILEGSVQRSGSRVMVTAQLINAATDTNLWAETYERDLQDVLTLQSEVASSVAREIRVALTPEEAKRLASARQVNPEAYEAYLKGRFHWYKLSKPELDNAERYFQLALAKDQNYALAYVGLADVWMLRSDAGFLSPQETMAKARAALAKALEIDETLADAHVSLANLDIFERDYPAAEKAFQRAIQLNPSHANAHFMYADYLISQLRKGEWEREVHTALELDPMSYFFQCFYGWQLVYVGRYDEAIVQLHKVLAAEPNYSSAHLGLWGAFYKKGMDQEAEQEAERFFLALGDQEVVGALREGNREAGYRRAMKRAADTLAARSARTHVPAVRIARLYAHAGENERTLYWLEKAYAAKESPLIHLAVARDWDGLRSHPRFQDLLRRMHLPQ